MKPIYRDPTTGLVIDLSASRPTMERVEDVRPMPELPDLERRIVNLKAMATEQPFRIRDIPEQAIALGEALLRERQRIAAAIALIDGWPTVRHSTLCGTQMTPSRGCGPTCGADAERERRARLIRALTGER